jgi:hypothetical protein
MLVIERLTTLGLLLAGLAVYRVAIPAQVEDIDYGTLNPRTIPQIAALAIVALAAVQLLLPAARPVDTPSPRGLVRALAVFVTVTLAVLALPRVGFLPVSAGLALALCLFMGERRLPWLILSVAVIPPGLWLVVTRLLDRSLP